MRAIHHSQQQTSNGVWAPSTVTCADTGRASSRQNTEGTGTGVEQELQVRLLCWCVKPAHLQRKRLFLLWLMLHVLGWPEPHIHVYGVYMYIRCFWRGNNQIYSHIRCMYAVMANPVYEPTHYTLCSHRPSPLAPCVTSHSRDCLHQAL